jgi:hypothetical protein
LRPRALEGMATIAINKHKEVIELKDKNPLHGSLGISVLIGAMGLVTAGCPSAATSPPVTTAEAAAVPAPSTPASVQPVATVQPALSTSAPAPATTSKDAAAPKASSSAATVGAPPGTPHEIAGREKCLSCHKVGPNVGKRGGTDMPASHAAHKDTGCVGCHKAMIAPKKDGG